MLYSEKKNILSLTLPVQFSPPHPDKGQMPHARRIPVEGGGVLVLKFLFDPCIISKKRETCFPRVRQRKEFDLTYMEVMEMLIDIGFSEPKHVDGESKLIDVLFIRP